MAETQAVSLRGINETLALLFEVDPTELTSELQAELELQIRETVLARGEKLDRIAGLLFQLGQRAAVKKAAAQAHAEKADTLKRESARAEADIKRLSDYVLAVMREMPKPKKGAIKIEGETSTFTAKGVPSSVEIYQELDLPDEFRTVTVTMSPDLWRELCALETLSKDFGDLEAKHGFVGKTEIKKALEVMVDCPHCVEGERLAKLSEEDQDVVECERCKGTGKVRATVPGARLIENKLRLEVS